MLQGDHSQHCGMDCNYIHGFPVMHRVECLGKVVANGLIHIVFLAMAWMFVRSSDYRSTITATI